MCNATTLPCNRFYPIFSGMLIEANLNLFFSYWNYWILVDFKSCWEPYGLSKYTLSKRIYKWQCNGPVQCAITVLVVIALKRL